MLDIQNILQVRLNVLLSLYLLNNWTCNVHTLMSLYEQWGIITNVRCQAATVTACDIKYHHSSLHIPIRIAWGVLMYSPWPLIGQTMTMETSHWSILAVVMQILTGPHWLLMLLKVNRMSHHMNYARLTRSDMLMFIYLGISQFLRTSKSQRKKYFVYPKRIMYFHLCFELRLGIQFYKNIFS